MNHLNEAKLLGQVDQILGPDGLLAKEGLDGLVFSQRQFEYACSAALGFCRYDDDLQRASLNILEAGTGTGKTIGYLVPLMLYAAQTGERVAVSTFTRQLQKQIVEKDAQLVTKWVKAITGKQLHIARRVGVNNYVSDSACRGVLGELRAQNKDGSHSLAIKFVFELLVWLREVDGNEKYVNSGLIDEFLEQTDFTAMPFGLSLTSLQLEHSSPDEELIRHREAIALSKEADVIVVNHALAVVNAFRWTSVLDEVNLRPISIMVFDEADRLVTASESLIGADLPLHKLTRIVQAYAESLDLPNASAKTNALHEFVMSLRPPAGELLAVADSDALSDYAKSALRSLRTLENEIADRMSQDGSLLEQDRNVKTLEFMDVANDLKEFCEALKSKDNSAIVSWSPILSFPSLRVSRPNPGHIMGRMWSVYDWDIHNKTSENEEKKTKLHRSYLRAALFTSATLATPGRGVVEQFDEFASSIGVIRRKGIHNTRTELYSVFEPTKFGTMSFVLADPRVVPPTLKIDSENFETNPLWLDYCETMIRTAHAAGDRCLVLALSYSDSDALGKRLSDLKDLIVHKSGQSLQNLLDQYVANPRALLISPAAWEGVNLPGMVNNLVITRIPFSATGDMQTAQQQLHFKSKGYEAGKIIKIIHNEAVSVTRKKLKQGMGRGIRAKTDKVTVWIADPRFPLPDSMSSSLDEILMASTVARVHATMSSCIPRRFLVGADDSQEGFSNAKLLLADGKIYSPSII